MTARHLVLFAFAGGLLAGGWAPLAAVPLAVVGAALAPRRGFALLAAGAVLLGCGLAQARRAAIDDGRVPARIGAVARGSVVVLERFRTRDSGDRVAAVRWRGGWADGERLLLRMDRRDPAPPAAAPGDVLDVMGRVGSLGPYEAIQRRRGAVARLEVWRVERTALRRSGLSGRLDAIRARSEAGLARGLPARDAALLRGMVLGQDEAIPRDVRTDFEASGLAHILAVSGTNVMLLAALVMAAGAVVGTPLRWRLGGALALVLLYVPLAGGGASIQRAGVMGAASLVAALAGRPSSRWYALGLAAAVTLALNPYAAGEPGWQLSFVAVAGLLLLAEPLRERLDARGTPVFLAEAAAMTVAATIATAPLLALHFDRVSLVSLPANLLAAPLVAPMMWLGMLAAMAAQVTAEAALPLNAVNGGLVAALAWLAGAAARIPNAAPAAGPLLVLGIYAAAGAAVIAWRRWVRPGGGRWPSAPRAGPTAALRGRPEAILGAAALTGVLAVLALAGGRGSAPARPGETVVSFLDVGQGDATLVQRDGASLLVDTGPPGGPVLERLREAGVRRLDVLLITHAQADHEGAAPAVIERFRPRLVLNGGAGWPTAVQRRLPRAATPVAGQTLALGALELRVLWPPREVMESAPAGDPNDRAVVAHLRSGDFDLLLPADAESPVTAALRLPAVEALKVAHHGSDDPGLPALLRRIRPVVAAIEVGRGNAYGHPTASTLAALRVVGSTLRTDRDGTVRLRVLGGRMVVERTRGLR